MTMKQCRNRKYLNNTLFILFFALFASSVEGTALPVKSSDFRLVLASKLKTRLNPTSTQLGSTFFFGQTVTTLEKKHIGDEVWVYIQDPFAPNQKGWAPIRYVGALAKSMTFDRAIKSARDNLKERLALSDLTRKTISAEQLLKKTLTVQQKKKALAYALTQKAYSKAWQLACLLYLESDSKALKHHMHSLSNLLSESFVELLSQGACQSSSPHLATSFTAEETFLIYQTAWYALAK